ncbi:histidine kinase-dna gyrase b-and hsp90-like domain containing protein [Stylonychia lemnae]|uniref:histidine kinase n=1 Tax=Stylonychia lemnae TaxID=5949 RepID=A0A078AI46_STYLE|nr:histidine kinase-dna gyrase b-and hsp90-like domain containing protein [Stylonychia lemnae]|eukprot:CDW81611.1 histidine kinase-dna gyrase b-and hsp90-like domain containing protein [Stylonychia lemnae]
MNSSHQENNDLEQIDLFLDSPQIQPSGSIKLLNTDELLIQRLKKSIPKQQSIQMVHLTIEDEEPHSSYFDNMWEYIQKYEQFFDQSHFTINPLDGLYFKLPKDEGIFSSEQENLKYKILQVFTQSIGDGDQKFVLTTIRDQSSWLEIEKQKNLSQLQTIAFASAAHEFRNPLNAIIQSLQLIDSSSDSNHSSNSSTNNQRQQYLQTALNSSQLMLYLVNDILDFSQFESRKLILNIRDVNAKEIIYQCHQILQLKAEVKQIQFIVEFASSFPRKIKTDPNRLAQIMINLISNSIKYTNEGFVKIVGDIDSNHNVQLKVIDTGVGMDKAQVKQLFTPFTKIMSNRHLNREGVGLGLTISKNLANALGGDILVESQVNKGSIFSVILPGQDNDMKSQSDYQLDAIESNVNIKTEDESMMSTVRNEKVNLLVNMEKINSTCNIDTRNLNLKKIGQLILEIKLLDQINIQGMILSCLHEESGFENNVQSIEPQLSGNFRRISSHQKFKKLPKAVSFKNLYESQLKQAQQKRHKTCTCSQILLVDDEPYNILALKGLISQLNVQNVDKCYNGQQALEKVKQNQNQCSFNHIPYQLIFLDNQMPVMNGFDTCRIMRSMQEQMTMFQGTKIILLTGDEMIPRKEEYQSLFDYTLLKPIDSKILQQILKKAKLIR